MKVTVVLVVIGTAENNHEEPRKKDGGIEPQEKKWNQRDDSIPKNRQNITKDARVMRRPPKLQGKLPVTMDFENNYK